MNEEQLYISFKNGVRLYIPESQLKNSITVVLGQYRMARDIINANIFLIEMNDERRISLDTSTIDNITCVEVEEWTITLPKIKYV